LIAHTTVDAAGGPVKEKPDGTSAENRASTGG